MSYEIKNLKQYNNDVRSITSYISDVLKNIDAAERLVIEVRKTISFISDFPRAGKILERENPYDREYRFLPVCNYLLFYYIRENVVYISRLIYARSDYAHLLET